MTSATPPTPSEQLTHADIEQLAQKIKSHSRPFRQLISEVGNTIVGQEQLIHRMLIGLLGQRSPVDRRRAGPGQDDRGRLPGERNPHRLSAAAVHARPVARRLDRHADLPAAGSAVRGAEGSDLFEPDSGRRNQPCAGQGAERTVGSDARAASHDRSRNVQARRAVPGNGHAEPRRAGRHLSAARSPDGPLHAQGGRRLSEPRPGAGDPRADVEDAANDRNPRGHHAGRNPRRPVARGRDLCRSQGPGVYCRPGAGHAKAARRTASTWAS